MAYIYIYHLADREKEIKEKYSHLHEMFEVSKLYKYTWCGYKIRGRNFFPLPCKLGNSERCVVLACALPSIHGYNFKVVGKEFGSSLCLEWIVLLFSSGIMLTVNP